MTRTKVAPDDPTRIDPSQPSFTNLTQRDASPAGASALALGTRIANRYVVRRFVGSGGCGEVYEVLDERAHRNVALKLNRQTQGDPWAAAALRGEFAMLATLRHPSLADVFDFGLLGDAAFFTQALVPGVHFDHAGLTLVEPRAIDLVMQLCRALAYLHARGILHRDVKPPNVLVDPSGERLVLLDFGIAHSFGSGPHSAVVGTPVYVAPEAIRGQPLDARSDLYSLGVLLYKLAAGQVPFPSRGRSIDDVYWDHLATAPPPLPASVPAPLAAIVMRLLEKEPVDRFASAGEVIDALARASDRSAARETPETLAGYVLSASFVDPARVLASAENACRAESPAHAVALVGEAGSGKSRLLRELRQRLQVRGTSWVSVQVRTGDLTDALLHDLATRVLTPEALDVLDPEDRIELVRVVPALRRRGERIAVPSDLERSRRLGIAALARAIATSFEGVIAIDDLHRASAPSASELAALVEAATRAGARCTFLVSGRPSLAMSAFARVGPVMLGAGLLDETGCRELVRATFGDADLLEGSALADAFRQAPRAALWVQESLRLAAERGLVVRRHARFERVLDVPALEPDALFEARVGHLPPSARAMALTCAIWSMPATLSELARAAGMRAARAGSALRELLRAGIGEEDRDARGRPTYAVHDRFAEVVPRSFSAELVARAHERAARAQSRPELAARHRLLAGDAAGARAGYLEAARDAEKSGHPSLALAWVDAAMRAAPDDVTIGDHLLRHDVAVTCGARMPAAESLAWLVARENDASSAAQIEIRLRVARRGVASGDAAGGRAAAARALTLAQSSGDTLAAARAHRITAEADWLFGSIEAALAAYERAATLATEHGDGDEAARAFIGASLAAIHLGRTGEGLRAAQSGVRAAGKSDDLALRSDAERQLGNVTRELGQSARARTYYRLAVRSARSAGCLEREGKALNNLGTVEHWLGDVPAGLEAFERSIALKERAGATASALLGYNNLAALRNALGQWPQSRATLDRIMRSPAADLALARPIALSNVGDLEIATGRLDEAIAAYDEGTSLCRERSLVMQQTHGLANLARALWMRDRDGDRARAAACLAELEDLAGRHELAEVRRRVHAVRAMSASMSGRVRDAVRDARAAVGVRDRHTRFSDLFHTPIEVRWILALALARAGRQTEAERHAARARHELNEMAEMLTDAAMRASYLDDHPLHAAVGARALDLPVGWTWRS